MADKPSSRKEEPKRDRQSSKGGIAKKKTEPRRVTVSSAARRDSAVQIPVQPGELVTLNAKEGALIGSFDDFVTSFAIGSSTSIQVPANADSLALAVNDNSETSDQPRDDDYIVDILRQRKRPPR